MILQAVNKLLAIKGRLIEGLFEKDGARDVATKARCGNKELAIGLTVGFWVVHSNRC